MIFYFRLARELGMSVSRLLREVSSREISGWMAFLQAEDEIEKRQKSKDSMKALDAQMTMMGKQAEKKKLKSEKWQRKRENMKSNGTLKKF